MESTAEPETAIGPLALDAPVGNPTSLDTLSGQGGERSPGPSELAHLARQRLDSPRFDHSPSWRRHCMTLFWPPTCRLCDHSVMVGMELCDSCFRQLEISRCHTSQVCSRCGLPGSGASLAGASLAGASAASGCLECRDQTLHYDRCLSVWRYDGLVRQAIVAAKFGQAVPLAETLGKRLGWRLLADDTWLRQSCPVADTDAAPDLIGWVPSHFSRRMTRGGGGAQALARAVHSVLTRRWPDLCRVNLLRTTRVVKKQAWLSETERAQNVRGAFAARRPWLNRSIPSSWLLHRLGGTAAIVAGKHVLVVDDVMTTGATLNEVAGVLKLAGAAQVTVAVAARAA